MPARMRWRRGGRENTKEAYNTGLDALARGLEAWSKSRTGASGPGGGRVPAVQVRPAPGGRCGSPPAPSASNPTGTTSPCPGSARLKTHESTRKLARRIEAGTARILSATLYPMTGPPVVSARSRSSCGGPRPPAHVRCSPHPVVGVDVGVKADSLLVVAAPDGTRSRPGPGPEVPDRSPGPAAGAAAAGRPPAAAPTIRPRRPGRQPSKRWAAHPDPDRPHSRPRRRRAPRRAAQGHHRAWRSSIR